MKKVLYMLMIVSLTSIFAGDCQEAVEKFWSRYDGIEAMEKGLPDETGRYNKLYAQILVMDMQFFEMGMAMARGFGTDYGPKDYLEELIPTIRRKCGGTTYEMREAAREGGERFQKVYERYQALKSQYLQNKNQKNNVATPSTKAEFIPATPNNSSSQGVNTSNKAEFVPINSNFSSNATSDTQEIQKLRRVIIDQLLPVLSLWDNANNIKNTQILQSLYGNNVLYYGSASTRDKCIKDKSRFFKRNPNFKQKSYLLGISVKSNDSYKIIFNKKVSLPGKETKTYPSYLVVRMVSGQMKIIEESDYVTDWNLRKRKMSKQERSPLLTSCMTPVVLQGKVEKIYVFSSPGFGEDLEKDQLVAYYMLIPNRPIKVLQESNSCEIDESSMVIYNIEIIALNEQEKEKIKQAYMQGNTIQLNGSLSTSETMYHITRIVFDVK